MWGVVVPAHTPPSLGFDTIDSTAEEFSSRIETEIPKWAKVIRIGGIKAE
jgi:hypothetical protein